MRWKRLAKRDYLKRAKFGPDEIDVIKGALRSPRDVLDTKTFTQALAESLHIYLDERGRPMGASAEIEFDARQAYYRRRRRHMGKSEPSREAIAKRMGFGRREHMLTRQWNRTSVFGSMLDGMKKP